MGWAIAQHRGFAREFGKLEAADADVIRAALSRFAINSNESAPWTRGRSSHRACLIAFRTSNHSAAPASPDPTASALADIGSRSRSCPMSGLSY